MKITITGEHEGRTVTIATWEFHGEVAGDPNIEIEEKLWTAIRQQTEYYIERVVNERTN